MDHKMEAANDQGPEVNPFTSEMLKKLNESNKRYAHDLDFLEGALDWIVNQTKAKLTEEERLQALVKLSTYPKSRIMELSEFSGAHFPNVWNFLDTVRVPEKHGVQREALPEPPSTLFRDFMEHMRIVNKAMDYEPKHPHSYDPEAFEAERLEVIRRKRAIEYKSLMALHSKYPHAKLDVAARMIGEVKK